MARNVGGQYNRSPVPPADDRGVNGWAIFEIKADHGLMETATLLKTEIHTSFICLCSEECQQTALKTKTGTNCTPGKASPASP